MANVAKPTRLPHDARIGVFTPSEPIISERLPRVKNGIEYLEKQGYRVITGANYLRNLYYMGGTVAERIEDIHTLLKADDINALMASWGGKSCNQLLPYLDYQLIAEQRKPIIGFSDSTCMANAIYAKSNLIAFLGPNIVGKLDESENSDLQALRYPQSSSILFGKNDSVSMVHPGKCTGRLIGGTITSFILGVLHTPYEPELKGSILVLEAGSKTPQLLDQLLTFVSNSGKLLGIAGLVICSLDHSKDDRNWGGRKSLDIILETFSPLGIPIIHTPVFGHGKLKNPVLPIGAMCRLDANEGILEAVEPFVE